MLLENLKNWHLSQIEFAIQMHPDSLFSYIDLAPIKFLGKQQL